jgi:hypothetical protein
MREPPGRCSRGRSGGGRPRAATLWAALLTCTGLLIVACGPAPTGAFHPGGTAVSGAGATGPAPPGPLADKSLAWPPFGPDVHIIMPSWLPADHREVPAVLAAKDFLLAYLYAEYRGDQDDRWTGYVSPSVLSALKSDLAQPGVTSESFTGTIVFKHIQASPDPTTKGAIDVSECFDDARSANTGLTTGKAVADHVPANQHYYLNTDVMAPDNGHWRVVAVDPVIYYPQAVECGP